MAAANKYKLPVIFSAHASHSWLKGMTSNGSSDNATSSTLPPTLEREEVAILLAASVILALAHIPVCIAAYRVSRRVNTFILFFSETFTNAATLLSTVAATNGINLILGYDGTSDPDLAFLAPLTSLFTFSTLLHNLLIAANRAFAVSLPLHYDRWWTRRVILGATLSVWVVNTVLKVVDALSAVLVTHDNSFFSAVYTRLQPATTYASLALYTASLVWVLARRATRAGIYGTRALPV